MLDVNRRLYDALSVLVGANLVSKTDEKKFILNEILLNSVTDEPESEPSSPYSPVSLPDPKPSSLCSSALSTTPSLAMSTPCQETMMPELTSIAEEDEFLGDSWSFGVSISDSLGLMGSSVFAGFDTSPWGTPMKVSKSGGLKTSSPYYPYMWTKQMKKSPLSIKLIHRFSMTENLLDSNNDEAMHSGNKQGHDVVGCIDSEK